MQKQENVFAINWSLFIGEPFVKEEVRKSYEFKEWKVTPFLYLLYAFTSSLLNESWFMNESFLSFHSFDKFIYQVVIHTQGCYISIHSPLK